VMMYSNFGIQMLGEILRRVGGKSLDALARERIFDPLGMVDTRYSLPEDLRSRVVWRQESAPYAEEMNSTEIQARPSPSGGLLSTAMDSAIFAQMFLNGGTYGPQRILSPVSVSAMTRNQIPGTSARFFDVEFPEASWGYGWSVNAPYKGEAYGEPLVSPRTFMHRGGGGTLLWVDPRDEIVGVYLSVVLAHRESDQPNEPVWSGDLFMNMIASAVVE
jgi:CubicO group peptidase (beta-lactamase class C family)